MSDTKFKWLTVASAIVIVLVVAMVLLPSKISSNSTDKSNLDSGEYVYADQWDVVHVDRKCKRLNYKGMSCDRIKRNELKSTAVTFCTNCVSDENYEQLTNQTTD